MQRPMYEGGRHDVGHACSMETACQQRLVPAAAASSHLTSALQAHDSDPCRSPHDGGYLISSRPGNSCVIRAMRWRVASVKQRRSTSLWQLWQALWQALWPIASVGVPCRTPARALQKPAAPENVGSAATRPASGDLRHGLGPPSMQSFGPGFGQLQQCDNTRLSCTSQCGDVSLVGAAGALHGSSCPGRLSVARPHSHSVAGVCTRGLRKRSVADGSWRWLTGSPLLRLSVQDTHSSAVGEC
jgi:hypothetical protein